MKTGRGWNALVKDKDITEHILTEKELEDRIDELWKGSPLSSSDIFGYPKHHVWEEDGIRYSSWEISPGMFTGDGGKEMYDKVLKEEFEKLFPFKTSDKDFINVKQ